GRRQIIMLRAHRALQTRRIAATESIPRLCQSEKHGVAGVLTLLLITRQTEQSRLAGAILTVGPVPILEQ
ncbi:MAG: hypothetical protein ACREU3_16870, partial [Steroidobacteraceae bacterium]